MDSKELRIKLDEMGVSFSDCIGAFAVDDDNPYAQYARTHLQKEGETEIDSGTVVSESSSDGAYVMIPEEETEEAEDTEV